MMVILSKNRKKEYPKSVTELFKARGKNICARRLLLHKLNYYIYLRIKEEVKVQNINTVFLEYPRIGRRNRGRP
jgi:hypothetical protein